MSLSVFCNFVLLQGMASLDMMDDENTDDQPMAKEMDPFKQHFEFLLTDDFADSILQKRCSWKTEETDLPGIGCGIECHPEDTSASLLSEANEDRSLCQLHVKRSLCAQVSMTNVKLAGVELKQDDSSFTALQRGLFGVINKYVDLYYPRRCYASAEELQFVYCLHVVNHVLKTRGRVLAHNAKLRSRTDDVPDHCRDQGLTRPKVVILLPFRHAALCVVNMIAHLLSSEQQSVMNKARFESEYGSADEPSVMGKKPEDYEATFKGNIDDNFRIGISITKKSVKLYTKFLSSDIIIASPVSLRAAMEPAEKGDSNECDFLSSVEIVIVDQADVLFMQNWDHVLYIFQHLNCQPKQANGVDFSRVRMWSLNGWSKLYRQTLIFSEFDLQCLRSLNTRHCSNYAGQLQVKPTASRCAWVQVVVRMRHEFCRFAVDSLVDVDDKRFEYFTSKILPLYTDAAMAQTLVFVSSSLDFIRLRNEFVRKEIEFVRLSEYNDTKETQRARGAFVHGRSHLALMSERFHFFRRYNHIRGIRHVVFYDLPNRPHFYAEICNWVRDLRRPLAEDSATCRVLYCKYDILRLRAVLGNERMQNLLLSEKDRYMFNPPALELHT